jgi:hypothetical protein
MTDLTKAENEDILTVHESDQAVEADDEIQYDPLDESSSVVVVEPPIISIGRAKRTAAIKAEKQITP